MNDWSSGYVTDLDYTYGHYPELNPLHCRLALLQAGAHCPQFETACELGFGQGVSVNVHAAASATQWYGADFNPAHAGFTRELAGASGADARLFDEAFADSCARPDLPDFDFIGLHGIWSWISDENRRARANQPAKRRLGTPVQAEPPADEGRQGREDGRGQPGGTQRPRAKIPATGTSCFQSAQSLKSTTPAHLG